MQLSNSVYLLYFCGGKEDQALGDISQETAYDKVVQLVFAKNEPSVHKDLGKEVQQGQITSLGQSVNGPSYNAVVIYIQMKEAGHRSDTLKKVLFFSVVESRDETHEYQLIHCHLVSRYKNGDLLY